MQNWTNPDECNVVDDIVDWIIVLVDDEFSNIVQFAIALLIDVSCINSPHTWFLAGQFICERCLKSLFLLTDRRSELR
jgi:hypothetical protein